MRTILKEEIKKERCNAAALGAYNASVIDPNNLHNSLSDFIEKNGYDTVVNRSKTSFGESDYIYVGKIEEGDSFLRTDQSSTLKIRISDHSVTNSDRVWGEYHISKGSKFKDVKNGALDAINFKFKREKFFTKKQSVSVKKNRLETPKPYGNDVVVSKRLNKAGDKMIYTVDRTYKNPVIQWINKRTKKVYQTIEERN